jgi:hypothetical protein
VACPRCDTRVVVPEEARVERTAFEGRDVERSLALLDRPATTTSPAPAVDEPSAAVAGAPRCVGVTLPWWSIYAGLAGFVVVAIVAFACGFWWCMAIGAR